MNRAASPRARAKREAILAAAFARFAQYGFRRTSLEDIAGEAGISRTAIYLHFQNKEEVFRALVEQLDEQGLGAAEDAAKQEGPIERRILGVLLAKHALFIDALRRSPHAAELLDENSRICGDLWARSNRRHRKLLGDLVREAVRRRELSPGAAGVDAAGAAELLIDAANGLKSGDPARQSPAAYRRRLADLVRVMVTGFGGTPAKSKGGSA